MKLKRTETQIEIVQLINQLMELLRKEYPNEKSDLIWRLNHFKQPILEDLGEHFIQEITRL